MTIYNTIKQKAVPVLAAIVTAVAPMSLYAHPHEDTKSETKVEAKQRTMKDTYFGVPLEEQAKRVLEATRVRIHKDLNPQLVFDRAAEIVWAKKRTSDGCLHPHHVTTDKNVVKQINELDYNKNGVLEPSEYRASLKELRKAEADNPILALTAQWCGDDWYQGWNEPVQPVPMPHIVPPDPNKRLLEELEEAFKQ